MAKVLKKPSALKRPSAARKPAGVFVLPIIPKKGSALRALRRPCSNRNDKIYTKVRTTPRIAKRDMKRPAGVFDVLRACSGKTLRSVLHKHGLLPPRQRCPHCDSKLRPDTFDNELASYKYRCSNRKCNRRVERLHGHPVFLTGRNRCPYHQQYLVMNSWLQGTPSGVIHLHYGISHATIERTSAKLRSHISSWVHKEQSHINFFAGGGIPEIEIDECTFTKFASGDKHKPIAWLGYVGLIRRGDPSSLKLIALPPRNTDERAPGPGPITKALWVSVLVTSLMLSMRTTLNLPIAIE